MAFFDATSWDEFPVGRKPVPSSLAELYSSRAAFDPDLFLTPEKKRVPTLVKLNSTDVTEFTSSSLRQSKVHFDQNVAVHHLSPDVSTDLSVMNSSEERNASPEALLTSYGRDLESPPIVRIDLSSAGDYFSPEDSERSSPRSDSTGELCADEICRNYMSSLTKDFNGFGLTDPELDLSLANSTDCEPISVMASDLRTAYNSSMSKSVGARVSTGKKSESLTAVTVNRSRPRAGVVRSGDGLERPKLRTGGSQGFASGGASAAIGGASAAMGGVLARPELNSTLRLTREMAELRSKEFDRHAVLKGNLDPKLKGKIDEKAYAKLNADSALYTNLLSLDVQEDELLNRAAEAQLAKAKPESGERVKPEDMVSKPPDIMEFFTPDLQPESPSFTLFGITQELTGPRTVDLDRAFDVYRHIRVWDRLN